MGTVGTAVLKSTTTLPAGEEDLEPDSVTSP
jgi:hypothetical protein